MSKSLSNKSISGSLNATGDISTSGFLKSNNSQGDEGGQIDLAPAATNTTIADGVTLDIFQNKLRIFEKGGSNRGFYLDITTGANGVGSILGAGATGATGPEGPQGDPGADGPAGADGDPGPGVASGGTAGQILTKVDGTDYNTQWSDNYAEKTYYLVRNNTGSTIPKGTLVSATGAEPSGRIDVAPHETTGSQDSELRVMGVTTASISNGVNGEVMSFGTLTGLDTRGSTASALAVGDETWAEGDILYAHPTVAGKLTNVRPKHDLAVAFITIRHASTGQIAVRIIPGNSHLEWMHDVAIDSPADNEVLAWDDSTSLWKNQTASEAGLSVVGHTHAIANVTDLQTTLDAKANLSGASLTGTTNVDDLVINGELTFNGTATTINSANLELTDSLIYLAAQQYDTDAVDIGIYGAYGDSNPGHLHTGLVRDHTDGVWKLISGGDEPTSNAVSFTGVTYDTLKVGALQATGTISANNGIAGATSKNMTVASAYSGSAFTGVRVIMTATTPGATAPTTRPDGTALQAGDIWFS